MSPAAAYGGRWEVGQVDYHWHCVVIIKTDLNLPHLVLKFSKDKVPLSVCTLAGPRTVPIPLPQCTTETRSCGDLSTQVTSEKPW